MFQIPRRPCLLLALLPSLALGCADRSGGGEASAAAVVRDSAGIEIVENPSPAEAGVPAFTLGAEPRVDIGLVEGASEYQLDDVTGALRLRDGRIVIADHGSKLLRFYDPEGRHLRSAGGEGGGPGEFQSIRGLHHVAGDSLLAWDPSAKRASIFDASGEFARSFEPQGETGIFPTLAAVLADGSFYLKPRFDPARLAALPEGEMRDSVRLVRYDASGGVRDTVGPFLGDEQFLLKTGDAFSFTRPLFGRSLEVAGGGDRLFAGTTDAFQVIEMRPDGTPLRIIRVPHTPVPVADQDVEQFWERRSGNFSGAPPAMREIMQRQAQQERERLPQRETFPAFASLQTDVDGRLWVRHTQSPGDDGPTMWSIFDDAGQLAASIETPGAVPRHGHRQRLDPRRRHGRSGRAARTAVPSHPKWIMSAHSNATLDRCGLTRPLPTALLLCAALTGCEGGDVAAPRAERVDSAGITIVRNSGEDLPVSWQFERTLSIGGADEGPEAFFNVGAKSVATDARGNIYVLDAGNHRVVVFDSDGEFLRSMGSEGGGPGEMQFPFALSVAPDGMVSVLDPAKRAFVSWGPTGEVLPSEPFELSFMMGGDMTRSADALVVPVSENDPQTQQGRYRLLSIRGSDTVSIAEMPRPELVMKDYGCVGLNLPPMFTPSLISAAAGDTVAVAASPEYEIGLYRAGERFASVRRDLPPRPITREMALQEVGEERRIGFGRGGECRIPGDKMVDTQGYAPVLPAIQALEVDPSGRIWVQRGHLKDEETSTDVFAADGEYLGTLPPGTLFPAAFMPDGRVVTVETDELDVPHVVVYRISEAEAE